MPLATTTQETAHVDTVIEEIRNRLNREQVEAEINQFIDIISSDEFLDYVNGIAELPTFAERRRRTIETANLSTLQALGVPTPTGLRLTTREFEIPEDGVYLRHAAGPGPPRIGPEDGILREPRLLPLRELRRLVEPPACSRSVVRAESRLTIHLGAP